VTSESTLSEGAAVGRSERRSTIDDVASLARVSRQTVSNVINDRGRLGHDTRRRVLRAIETLRYSPHPGASSLRSGRTMQLAHPMPAIELDPGNAIAIEFIQALVVAAARRDHHVVLSASHDDAADTEDLIRSGRVDGFVFTSLEPRDPRLVLVAERGVAFACFGRTEADLPQCWVDIDNAAAIAIAVEHLLAKGYTDIAYLGYSGDAYWDYERIDGYRAAMDASGLPCEQVLCPNSPAGIEAALAELFGRTALPTAIVAGSDALAAALYSAAERRGIQIGVDLAVTGFDGSLVGRNLVPRLTTVSIPVAEIADLVVDRVLREVEGPTGDPGQFVPVTLSVGESA
jgi:DNA-binding LacI/PurR family transcriptional regulator